MSPGEVGGGGAAEHRWTRGKGGREVGGWNGKRFLRGPGDEGGQRVGVGQAREHGVRAANVPVVVVALYGYRGGV